MYRQIDFAQYSAIHIGPVTSVLLLDCVMSLPADHFLLGGANNLLIAPTPPLLAMLAKTFDYIEDAGELLRIGAATPSGKILSYAKKHNLGGFELMQKLPGTLGGMIKMNAGLKAHEVFNLLYSIQTDKGSFLKAEIPHGYRTTTIEGVIYEATFVKQSGFDVTLLEHFKALRANQPPEPSAGSCFKNPPGHFAGQLIEAAGLKGYRIGNMAMSSQHANFLVNLGGGTFEEAKALIALVEEKVYQTSGVILEKEIIVVEK